MKALIPLIVVAVVGLGVLGYIVQKKRREAIAGFARRYGFQYSKRDPFNLLWDYNFPLLEMGRQRGCENVVWGEWKGVPFRETDYWYKEPGMSEDDMDHYERWNAVIVDIPAYLPIVTIQRETASTRLADRLGFRDIQFESDEFNRAFRVTGEDKAFVFKLVDPRMMEWLLTTDPRFGFQFRGSATLVFSKRLRPDDLLPLIGTSKELYEHIPRLVWTDYASGPAPSAESAP